MTTTTKDNVDNELQEQEAKRVAAAEAEQQSLLDSAIEQDQSTNNVELQGQISRKLQRLQKQDAAKFRKQWETASKSGKLNIHRLYDYFHEGDPVDKVEFADNCVKAWKATLGVRLKAKFPKVYKYTDDKILLPIAWSQFAGEKIASDIKKPAQTTTKRAAKWLLTAQM